LLLACWPGSAPQDSISFLLSWELHDESVFGLPLHERVNAAVAAAR
jgi:hypothetical protein